MKARIKKTGEVINIADYAKVTLESCDSYGNPIELGFDDVEILNEKFEDIDWEQRRYELAKAAMQGLINATSVERFTPRIDPSDIAVASVKYADALIKELKKEK